MTIFYFTSTGNCLYVAKRIGGTLLSIPQLMQKGELEFSDDVVGLVFPTYGFGMPKMVKAFMERVKWQAEYSFAVATYGNMTGAVLPGLQSCAEKHGKHFDYMATLLMVDNYLPGFEMDDQRAKLPEKQVEENLARIIGDIQTRQTNSPSASLGQRVFTRLIQAGEGLLWNGNQAKGYIVNERCNQCGTCARVCPAGNIEVKDSVAFFDRCEACLGCVQLCPQNAIHLKNERSAARFRNEHVSVKEIIDANNRLA